jgi:cell division protein FtsB
MKFLIVVLISLFIILQYRLWFDNNGIAAVWRHEKAISAQTTENLQLKQKNDALAAEVADLKLGHAAIEERARNDLGMIKKDETFYQFVDKP